MIEVFLLFGRILLVALLFLFLFAVMRTGIGLVKGQNRRGKQWTVQVLDGPRSISGLKLALSGPLVVGRAPGADIVVDAEFVSARHARLTPLADHLIVEDLGSTNGTLVNGRVVTEPHVLADGDKINIGDVVLQVLYA